MTHKEFITKWMKVIPSNEKQDFVEDFYICLELELIAQKERLLKIIDDTIRK